jgi:hypothetical protein
MYGPDSDVEDCCQNEVTLRLIILSGYAVVSVSLTSEASWKEIPKLVNVCLKSSEPKLQCKVRIYVNWRLITKTLRGLYHRSLKIEVNVKLCVVNHCHLNCKGIWRRCVTLGSSELGGIRTSLVLWFICSLLHGMKTSIFISIGVFGFRCWFDAFTLHFYVSSFKSYAVP